MRIIRGKIGTHSSVALMMWEDRVAEKGQTIMAMELSLFESLHSSVRRLKKCQYWQRLRVADIGEDGFLFLDR